MLSVAVAMILSMSAAHPSSIPGASADPVAPAAGGHRRRWAPGHPLDLGQSLGVLGRGAAHTTVRVESAHCVWITSRVRGAPVTVRFTRAGEGPALERDVVADAWGPGARAFLAEAPAWCGQDDDWSGLLESPAGRQLPQSLRRASREHPGMRLISTGRLFEALVVAVLEQRVTADEAIRAQRWLARAHGDPAPGPAPRGMAVLPSPEQLRRVPSWAWHRAGVDPARSRTLHAVAGRAAALERWDRAPLGPELQRAVGSLPGVGPWTLAEALQVTHADPDSVSVLDYHLAHHVTEFFDGRRGDDARMLELLEPWRGHRQRVVRLLRVSGWRAQRKGPRLTPEDHRER